MEPMALGSAPSSPSSPGANANYLPAFLMGSAQSATPTPSVSPERQRNISYNLSSPEQPHLRHRLFSPATPDIVPVVVQSPYEVTVSKPGPPKQSLFDTIDIKKGPNTPSFSGTRENYAAESPAFHDSFSRPLGGPNQSLSNFNGSLCKNDSLNNLETFKSDINPNLWVTVFGFPSNSASLVLARFANCGSIIEKRFPTQGNWVHLKFSTPQETAKALALNGKLISNCIMVGVVPHQSKQANKENADVSLYTSPMRVRSLRHSYVSPQNSNTVLPLQNVPQKSTGLVTKAMEYVFGW